MELIQRVEAVIGKKMDLWPTDEEDIALLRERVEEAARVAATELKDQGKGAYGRKKRRDDGGSGGGRDDRDRDDDMVEAGMPQRIKGKGRPRTTNRR